MMSQTIEEVDRYPNRQRFILLAHIEALRDDAERTRWPRRIPNVNAAHHEALNEQAYRQCRVYGMGSRNL